MDKKLAVANIGMKFGMCHVESATTGKVVKPNYEF